MEGFQGRSAESQDRIVVVTVLCVPSLLDSGNIEVPCLRGGWGGCSCRLRERQREREEDIERGRERESERERVMQHASTQGCESRVLRVEG